MDINGVSRRSFLISSLTGALALVAGLGRAAWAAGEDLAKKLVKESDPTPKALKYVADAKKAPKTLRKADDQKCNNCMHYKEAGDVSGKKVGSCALFGGGLVYAEGWCFSFAKKAG